MEPTSDRTFRTFQGGGVMKRWCAVLILALVVVAYSFRGAPAAPPQVVKIGVVYPLTGPGPAAPGRPRRAPQPGRGLDRAGRRRPPDEPRVGVQRDRAAGHPAGGRRDH